jgi:large subunit ribosomal protein L22
VEVKAQLSNLRVSPRKVAPLAKACRDKGINEALTYLRFSPRKRIAQALRTLLKSAVANATQKGTVDVDNLYVKTLLVGAGPTLKRFQTRAKGSAFRILKRTSLVKVTLAER